MNGDGQTKDIEWINPMASELRADRLSSHDPDALRHGLLYEADETAWLDLMAILARERRIAEIDWDHLSQFLSDMARNDRRNVVARLERLLEHLLKWQYQPERRSRSWERTIVEQRARLSDLFESETLRNYGQDVLAKAYGRAVILATVATGLDAEVFPPQCPYALAEVLTIEYGSESSGPDV